VPALVSFFQALADPRRLQIAGRLAGAQHTVDELAALLAAKPAAVQKQLDYLVHADLAEGPSGLQQRYRLRLDRIHALAGQVLGRKPVEVPPGAAADAYERKVLREFLRADGTIRDFPMGEKRFMVLVRYALRALEPGRRYTEKQVNARLQRLHPDSALLRRAMVDHGLVQREANGAAYWRV
jgi:hypothetical protein